MKFRLGIGALALAALCAAGCNKAEKSATANPAPSAMTSHGEATSVASPPGTVGTSDEEAVKAAIGRHLRENSGINLSAMDTIIDSVSIQGDNAQANVTFRLKQGGTTMLMTYSLTRHAKDWLVMHSEPGGGQFAHPPMDKAHSGAAETPQTPGTPNLRRFYKHDSSSSSAGAPATKTSPEK